MSEYTLYDVASGRIATSLTTGNPANLAANLRPGQDWIAGLYGPGEFYVIDPRGVDFAPDQITINPGSVAPRPRAPVPLASPYTLTALPAGTVVTVSNEAGDILEISDMLGDLELIDPGLYRITVAPPWPYVTETTEIEVE